MKKNQSMPVWLRKIVLEKHYSLLAVAAKAAAVLCTCRKECNKYDLIEAHCFRLVHHNDWFRWFVISNPPPICCLSFSFIGGVAKK